MAPPEGAGATPEVTGDRTRRALSLTAGHRRRPSGEPPPLPHQLGRSGLFWIVMVAYFVSVLIGVLLFESFAGFFERWDTMRLQWIETLRVGWLTRAMLAVNLLVSPWTIRVLRWGTIIALVVFRRWRHLGVFIGSVLLLSITAYEISLIIARPRPIGVGILGNWSGFSMPSRPVAGLAVTLIGIAYALIVPGKPRTAAKWAVGAIMGIVFFARMYLGVDQPTSAGFGAILGVAIGLTAFRWFCPNDVFPVSYRRAKAAHLDVTGRRAGAIVKGVRDQIGFGVLEIKPVGLEGSGGSTPLRLRVDASSGDAERYLFAKLYAKSHVRADRWYKLGRTLLYGALEDETRFTSVRRFVEYEDYTLRLMADFELPVCRPYGVVELTPEREYMIVMEFFEDAVEISDAEIDEDTIDEGLRVIVRLWESGLAHRDIKPANLMVKDGHLKLIDVFFVQVRPSPWRQAVDLANMMMVLALGSDPDGVYERALRYFTPSEIAEAFAAARGVALPTQLRRMLKEDGRGIAERFRELAPAREPVTIQRWSGRRLALLGGVVAAGVLALAFVVNYWAVFA